MVPCILECGTSRRSRVTGNKPIGAFYWIGKNEVLPVEIRWMLMG